MQLLAFWCIHQREEGHWRKKKIAQCHRWPIVGHFSFIVINIYFFFLYIYSYIYIDYVSSVCVCASSSLQYTCAILDGGETLCFSLFSESKISLTGPRIQSKHETYSHTYNSNKNKNTHFFFSHSVLGDNFQEDKIVLQTGWHNKTLWPNTIFFLSMNFSVFILFN